MGDKRHGAASASASLATTLDGVVSLNTKGHASGGDISRFSAQDRIVMELMRAIADVVIIGAGALSADRRHVWTAAAILPALADEYQRLSEALGQRDPPLNVIVSGSGKVDLRLPVFTSGKVPALIITTSAGAKRLCEQSGSASVDIRAIRGSKTAIPAGAILVRGVPGTPRQANSRRGRAAIAGRLLRGTTRRRAVPDARAADRRARRGRPTAQPGHGQGVRARQSSMGEHDRRAAAAICSCGTGFPNPGPAGGLAPNDLVVFALEHYSRRTSE